MEFDNKFFNNTPLINAVQEDKTKIAKLLLKDISLSVNCKDIF